MSYTTNEVLEALRTQMESDKSLRKKVEVAVKKSNRGSIMAIIRWVIEKFFGSFIQNIANRVMNAILDR